MNGTRPWRHLLRTGLGAGRRGEAGRIRFVALLCATVVLTLTVASAAAVHAVYDGKERRAAAREPVSSEDTGTPATALWQVSSDWLADRRQFDLVHLAPLSDDAPLPPGVADWPGPGEVLLSPALRAAGRGEGIEKRYGRTAGTIGAEGLADPAERLAYLVHRPEDLDTSYAVEISGYGPGDGLRGPGMGPYPREDKPEWMFQALLGGMLLLPGLALLWVAARTGAHARDRRTALVTALGGRRTDRALFAVGEAWRPVAVGGALGTLAVVTAMTVDIRLPVTDYVVPSVDLRRWAWLMLSAPWLTVCGVLTTAVLTDRAPARRRQRSVRPAGRRGSLAHWAALCPVAVFVAVRGAEFFPAESPGRALTNWTGTAVALLTLPSALAVTTAALGRVLADAGRARGRPGLLVAGRRLSAHAGETARMVCGVAIALCLLFQAVAWQQVFGEQAHAARQTLARIGTSVVTVGPKGEGDGGAVGSAQTRFVDGLPDGVEALAFTVRPSGTVVFQGGCPALRAMRLPCPARAARLGSPPADPRVRALLAWRGIPSATVHAERAPRAPRYAVDAENGGSLILVSAEGEDLSVPSLKRLAYRTFPRGARIDAPGADQLVGGAANRDQGRWSALLGLAAVIVLALTAALACMAAHLRAGRALAPLTVLAGRDTVFLTIAAWSVAVPLTVSGVAGTVVGVWLTQPVTRPFGYSFPDSVMTAPLAVVAFTASATWLWAATTAVRLARAWRPGGE
ncbi:ABC transporter permease [Streptomyces sp. NPDC095613]|uniref:ABC transporter permease n=1 Tax=Streptomyces sp. NPDC095613 TaxID=3155540 RepID=UPI003331C9A7